MNNKLEKICIYRSIDIIFIHKKNRGGNMGATKPLSNKKEGGKKRGEKKEIRKRRHMSSKKDTFQPIFLNGRKKGTFHDKMNFQN